MVDNLPAMTSARREEARAKVAPAPPIYVGARAEFAKRFLVGEAPEIVLRKQGGWPDPPSLDAPATRSFAQGAAPTLRCVGKRER